VCSCAQFDQALDLSDVWTEGCGAADYINEDDCAAQSTMSAEASNRLAAQEVSDHFPVELTLCLEGGAFSAEIQANPADFAVTPVVTSVATLPAGGYATYRLSVVLGPLAESLYSIHATADAFGMEAATSISGTPGPMRLPAAFQVATPFGADVGGVNPVLIETNADAAFDSWLTVGLSEGNGDGALSTIGIDFDAWTETSELEVTDGAVFAMAPLTFEAGTADEVLVAQLTIPEDVSTTVQMGMQGAMLDDAFLDWRVDGVTFEVASAASPDPEEPAPAPPPAPATEPAEPAAEPAAETPAPVPAPVEPAAEPVPEPEPEPDGSWSLAEETALCVDWNGCGVGAVLIDAADTTDGADSATCCRSVLCGEWDVDSDCGDDTVIVDDAETTEGADASVCCRAVLCNEWDEANDCEVGTVIIEDAETVEGNDAGACCREEFCTEWDERHDCDAGTAIIDAAATTMGSTSTVCCDITPPPPEPPAAIPQAPVTVTIQTFADPAAEAEAATALLAALEAATTSEASEAVEIASSVAFPVLDPIPPSFAGDFQVAMAGSIGGGGVFTPEQILLSEEFLGGRRRLQDTMDVDFTISAPATMADTAASLVVAAASEPLVITIGNTTLSGTVSGDPPVVQTYVDCAGSWTPCGQSCVKYFAVTQVATGIGQDCVALHLDEQDCSGDFCAPPPPPAVPSGGGGGGGGGGASPPPPAEDSLDNTMLYAGGGVGGLLVVLLLFRTMCGGGKEGEAEGKKFDNPLNED
jgi:hypothetical protein